MSTYTVHSCIPYNRDRCRAINAISSAENWWVQRTVEGSTPEFFPVAAWGLLCNGRTVALEVKDGGTLAPIALRDDEALRHLPTEDPLRTHLATKEAA